MSKLEILLIGVILLIGAGVGFYHFKDRLFLEKYEVKPVQETTPISSQGAAVKESGIDIGKMCIKTMEKSLRVAEKCKELYGNEGKLAKKTTSAMIESIKNPTKENHESVEKYQREAAGLDALRNRCTRFFPFAQRIKEITPLVKAGRFDEAQRLCREIDAAIPEGL